MIFKDKWNTNLLLYWHNSKYNSLEVIAIQSSEYTENTELYILWYVKYIWIKLSLENMQCPNVAISA